MDELYLIVLFLSKFFINFIYCDDSSISRFDSDESNEFSIFGTAITYNQSCANKYHCIGPNEICRPSGICKCKDHYEFNELIGGCVKCSGYGGVCLDSCCAQSNLQCIKNRCVCVNDIGPIHLCTVSKNGVFMTASQIALSAALIMAIAALIMVIYRLCTKPRNLSRNESSDPLAISRNSNSNVTTNNNSNNGNSNFLRESLSSMQIRILSRLRDRPPAYDETTNSIQNSNTEGHQQSEHHQQQEQRQQRRQQQHRQQQQQQQQQQHILATTISIPEAPPPYEAGREVSVSQLPPPPYSEIIINPSNLTATSQNEHGQQNNEIQIKSVSSNDEQNQKEITVKRNL